MYDIIVIFRAVRDFFRLIKVTTNRYISILSVSKKSYELTQISLKQIEGILHAGYKNIIILDLLLSVLQKMIPDKVKCNLRQVNRRYRQNQTFPLSRSNSIWQMETEKKLWNKEVPVFSRRNSIMLTYVIVSNLSSLNFKLKT